MLGGWGKRFTLGVAHGAWFFTVTFTVFAVLAWLVACALAHCAFTRSLLAPALAVGLVCRAAPHLRTGQLDKNYFNILNQAWQLLLFIYQDNLITCSAICSKWPEFRCPFLCCPLPSNPITLSFGTGRSRMLWRDEFSLMCKYLINPVKIATPKFN